MASRMPGEFGAKDANFQLPTVFVQTETASKTPLIDRAPQKAAARRIQNSDLI